MMSFNQNNKFSTMTTNMEYYGPDIQISDVLDIINEETKQTIPPSVPTFLPAPYVEIVEQPASTALRFRYICEGRMAGSIPGVNSTTENKTYPSIMVHNYVGKVALVISCVTKDAPYRPHPHKITARDNCRNGVIYTHINAGEVVPLTNLGIQCVKKKEVMDSLRQREEMNVDPFNTGFSHINRATNIDLNAVRLAFQVFVKKDKKPNPIEPVVSDVIYDKKNVNELVIDKLSHCSASVAGGLEMILLCGKVTKDDIQVRFYEEVNSQLKWEGFGDFHSNQVHRQVAITFRTPRYIDQDIETPVRVLVELRRPSDGTTSAPVNFEMTPLGSGSSYILRKSLRKKSDLFSLLAWSNLSRTPYNSFSHGDLRDTNCKISALRALRNEVRNGKATKQEKTLENDTIKASKPEADCSEESAKVNDKNDSNEPETVLENEKTVKSVSVNENDNLPVTETSENLNELLTEVAEIYADTQAKLVKERAVNGTDNLDVHDNQTYTSLQMAMKNPLELFSNDKNEEKDSSPSPPLPAKRDALEERPPLPPKRIRKTPSLPVLPRPNSIVDAAPKKALPTPVISPKQSMHGLFSKLFKKGKKDKELSESSSIKDNSSLLDIYAGDKTPPYGFDLTEAENFALYTDMAPHATVSEFDEMSFYYSPVEGGKILTDEKKT